VWGSRLARLIPRSLKGVRLLKDITLVWESPQGDLDSFEVQYLDAQGRLIQNFTYTNSISIGGLRPYRHQFHIPTHLIISMSLKGENFATFYF
jgi:hypothetical protein